MEMDGGFAPCPPYKVIYFEKKGNNEKEIEREIETKGVRKKIVKENAYAKQ